MKKYRPSAGFTVIEVLIVAAIAALILLIVFLVVPTVERSARNHSRKVIANFLVGEMEEYKALNRHYPGEGGASNGSNFAEMCDFATNYVSDYFEPQTACNPSLFESGSGAGNRDCVYVKGSKAFNLCYRYRPTASHYTEGEIDDFYIMIGHWCNRAPHYNSFDNGAPITSENAGDPHGASPNLRAYVVYTPLESAPMYCVDSDTVSF